jgi:photosystem II stability/assembly factor-like uncharacterized protein
MVTSSLVAVGHAVAAGEPSAAAATQYSWKNVRIDGGGFVPGIVFNQKQPNLVYARTDIGGAYRWNAADGTWVPLLDWVGQSNWGYNGVVSLATDEVAPNRLYAAVGMYTNDWDPNPGAILRSSDQGKTWSETKLPFKLGGNMPGRGMGERLVVDPNDNTILYFGAPSGKGLWRSIDSGVTWAQVANFPNPGNYVASPGDSYGGDNQGVAWVTFDKTTATAAGRATQTIYVGVADKDNTVYRTTNGGASWERIPGQPEGYIAHKGVLDHVNHVLYLATSDTGGPYDGAHGDVWKLDTVSGTWTQISPIPSSNTNDNYFGYSGLTIDRTNPKTIMVATQISWWPDAIFFRSTDAGATWTRIWDWDGYPNRKNRFTMDISANPWLTFGGNPAPPETAPKLGWMNESVEIDPFNPDRLMYGTGATIYGTTDLTKWDTGGTFTIKPMARGLEETAVLDLISPPSGPSLVSGLGDIGGFRHDDLTAVPAMMFTGPAFTTTTSLDYAESNPSVMVRAGNFADSDRPNDAHAAFSTDGGKSWFQGTEPGGIDEGGTIAAAADGSRFVWAPKNNPAVFSVGFGNTWSQAQGLPQNAIVESDRVNPKKFYALSGGRFYLSTDGGATFAATAATGLPSSGKFKAVPGREGDIWLAGGDSGLLRSTNSGASFTKVATVAGAINLGFGKAASGKSYQALYLIGTIGNTQGIFRSDDTGASWVRINDDQRQYGNAGEAITGDPRVYGRVYLGTNGRGVIYGDGTGGTPATDPSASSAEPSSESPSESPSGGSASPSTPALGGCSASLQVVGSWQGGLQGTVTVTNTDPAALTGWKVTMILPDGVTIQQAWNGTLTTSGTTATITNVSWNGALVPTATAAFGFVASAASADVDLGLTCTAGQQSPA